MLEKLAFFTYFSPPGAKEKMVEEEKKRAKENVDDQMADVSSGDALTGKEKRRRKCENGNATARKEDGKTGCVVTSFMRNAIILTGVSLSI